MNVIFLFIDGVGLGEANKDNPFYKNRWNSFLYMSGDQPFIKRAVPIVKEDHFFTALDATLGVDGLPQSGTGQTTLFSGENAAKKIGRHFGPYPHSEIKPLLREKSLFIKARQQHNTCAFINAYPDVFFKKAEAYNRWSCTTLMTKSAGIPLNTSREVKRGEAVTAGLTQQAWREKLNIDIPVITPEQAAYRLINQSVKYDILLHEYYLTDKAGHHRLSESAESILDRYDRFLGMLIREKPEEATLILSSDHGNIEDLSTKTHTVNKVPLFVLGPGAPVFRNAESLMDVTPGILNILKKGEG